jgi:hypothetical protein
VISEENRQWPLGHQAMQIDWSSQAFVKNVAGEECYNLPAFADTVLFGLSQVGHEQLTWSNLFVHPFGGEYIVFTCHRQDQLVVIGTTSPDFLSVPKLGVRTKTCIGDN